MKSARVTLGASVVGWPGFGSGGLMVHSLDVAIKDPVAAAAVSIGIGSVIRRWSCQLDSMVSFQ